MVDVLRLDEIDGTQRALVGGKAANLGELRRLEGVDVPDGFCVTTSAFRRVVTVPPGFSDRLDRLARLTPEDVTAIRTVSAELRVAIENVPLPDELVAAIEGGLARLGEHAAYAVRSSATAEDLPTASFAGQQDSYLNVVGVPAILAHVRRCWASLFTERAVAYRRKNAVAPHALMGVVVQRMVAPQAAGVLFTADPVTSNRRITTVEAVWGLGEALVSGRTTGDVYRVRDDDVVVSTTVAPKSRAVHAQRGGGTDERTVEPLRQTMPALTDAQVVRLARLGRRIEAHFGRPQDIEWCLAGDDFVVVQSRPITTLFPVPATDDGRHHVYISVGHQQMMTDPMKPLGLSFWQRTTRASMVEAGGRLFVDVAPVLASPAGRAGFLDMVRRSDPLIGDALQFVVDRGDPLSPVPHEPPRRAPAGAAPAPIATDPAIVRELIEDSRASIAALRHDIRDVSGPALFDVILADLGELQRILFDARSHQVIMAGMEAAWWLSDHLETWLGEKNAADRLAQSVPDNVTSEMGLALLEVADVMRPHPEVVMFLQHVMADGCGDDGFLDGLASVSGGRAARDALEAFLDRYGMRCVGEIDITRPRWSERPETLVPALLGHISNAEPGEGRRRFEQGRREARAKEREVLFRLRELPDGEHKAAETKRMIDRVRTFAGYREYPKYAMISRYFVYKQALLREADRLVRAGVLREREDVFYLRLQEFHEVVRTQRLDQQLVDERKAAFTSYAALTPPRVLTSDGEVITGSYRRDDVPAGALAGLPVSAGTVEGRARVVLDVAQADLEPGDILVTAYTDPSWTPLFVAIAGLVTEVGGLMTHGAVIAREYGLPAVVSVVDATRLIPDGQRIRVHGTDGYIELLP